VQVLRPTCFRPAGRPLVVCNPPWVPAPAGLGAGAARCTTKTAACCAAFWQGLAAHLAPGGEGWLVLSDLAEHLGLRPRALLGWIADAGLRVLGRLDTRPRHGRPLDATDPLHAARAAEVTSLWRLGAA
jgi:methylase of polypeptide subunit release factors